MRRLSITLALICLLVLTTPVLTLAQPGYTPHEDPSLARAAPDLTALLTYYGNIFSAAALGKYVDAQSLLTELARAQIPDELTVLANRFSALASALFGKIDRADRLLDEVTELLATNQPQAVRAKLDTAAADIQDAQSLLIDIDFAARSMKSALGTFAAPVLRQIESAYARLEQSLLRLTSLLDEISRLRQTLAARQETQVTRLLPTTLTLETNPSTAFVGESVTASGFLSGNTPLSGRKVTLQLGRETTIATTRSDGAFTAKMNIPYLYVSQIALQAVYLPAGDDTAIYLAAESQPATINASYYPTRLDASVPEKTHPGFPTPIIGQLSSPGIEVERTMKVFLDDTLLAERQVKGQFDFEIVPPADTKPGKHELTLAVLPLDRNSGATEQSTVNVSILPVDADILMPSVVVLPWQTGVSGKVTSDRAPVPDASIEIRLGRSLTSVRTAADGSFSANVNAPFNLSLAGPQEMGVTVTPTQPWYEPLEIKREVFTINPANILLILLAAGSLGLLLYRRGRSAIPAPAPQRVVAQPLTPQPSPTTPAPIPKHEFIGFKSIILSSYFSAVEAIGNLTGVVLGETMTLREFLKTTAPKIATSARSFTELTALAELALYSTRQLDAETASRAEKQANAIREEMRLATS